MAEDSILIRAERLIRGDVVSWRVGLIEFEIVLEYVQGSHSDLRTTVSRDRKFRVLLLV